MYRFFDRTTSRLFTALDWNNFAGVERGRHQESPRIRDDLKLAAQPCIAIADVTGVQLIVQSGHIDNVWQFSCSLWMASFIIEHLPTDMRIKDVEALGFASIQVSGGEQVTLRERTFVSGQRVTLASGQLAQLVSLEGDRLLVDVLSEDGRYIDGSQPRRTVPVASVLPSVWVRLTAGGLDRVLGGQVGMEFEVNQFTQGTDGPVAHVRDLRALSRGPSKGFQIWSIGADGYEVVEGEIPHGVEA